MVPSPVMLLSSVARGWAMVSTALLVGCSRERPERLTTFLASSAPAAPSAPVVAAISRLSPAEARALPGALWLDVRTRAERSQGYLPASRLLPLDELPRRLPELDSARHQDILLVCASGHRATEAASTLQQAGFTKVHVLDGGMLAWDQPVTAPRLDPDGPGFVERFRVGASFVVVQQPDDEHPRAGLEVHVVYSGGATRGKLRPGDVVVGETSPPGPLPISRGEGEISSGGISSVPGPRSVSHGVSYRSLFPPGKSLPLRVLDPDGVPRTETLEPPPPAPALSPPPLLAGPLAERWKQEAAPALGSPEGVALRRAFQAQTLAWAPAALPLPASLLLDPARLASLLASPPGDFREREPRALLLRALEESEALLGVKKDTSRRAPGPAGCCGSAEALLGWVAGVVRESRREAARSLDAFGEAERGRFAGRVEKFRGAMERQVFLHDARGKGEARELAALAEEGRRFRAGACVAGVRRLAGVLEPAVLEALRGASWPEREAPAGSGVEGLVRGWLDTPEGPVVLGGQGANRYRGRFLAILDAGGEDRYELRSGEEPSLVLDLAGDDEYAVEEGPAWAPGRALLLADLAGNDRYRSAGAGLASGYFSASALVDAAGDDRYEAGHGGLGAGRFGVGVLVDAAGNDRYQGGRATQGFGGPGGVGVLVDAAGEDRYESGPSEGVDHREAQLSQGCGMGIREMAYGGVGLLVDLAGNDRYQAREYAQGVGYFGGLGVLRDRGGNDEYRGRKYSQGAGVHGAVGLLLDEGGDDRYVMEGAERGQGMAWDLAVAALIDLAGEDRYEASGLAQGYGAQNGLALLVDLGGGALRGCRDEGGCGGKAGRNDYAGGRGAGSLAWFWGK